MPQEDRHALLLENIHYARRVNEANFVSLYRSQIPPGARVGWDFELKRLADLWAELIPEVAPPPSGAANYEEAKQRLHDFHRALDRALPPAQPKNQAAAAKLTKAQAEARVAHYLRKRRKRAAAGEVSIREIEAKTGVPMSSIARTAPWQALQNRLSEAGLSKRPLPKKAKALTAKLERNVGERDSELQRLINEHEADVGLDTHDPGAERRTKMRIRKQA